MKEKMKNNSMKKHIPERMCVACRRMLPKNELIRIVKKDSEVIFDEKQKVLARGIYLCKNEECIKQAEKKRAFERLLKCENALVYYERAREIWIKSLD